MTGPPAAPKRRTFAARRVTRTALIGLLLLVAVAAWWGRDQHPTSPAPPSTPTATTPAGTPPTTTP